MFLVFALKLFSDVDMKALSQEIRYGIRMLARSPAFTVIAVLTLAVGIGANTAIFSLIDAVLLKMLPVSHPEELVAVGDPSRANERSLGIPQVSIFSFPLYRDLRDGNRVFSGLLASGNEHRIRVETDTAGEVSSSATGALVSGNYFLVLGVSPYLGRTLTPDDDRNIGAHPVAMVSYSFWQKRLSANPTIVGQSVRLNGHPFAIVGVGPQEFHGDTIGDPQDFWIPMMMQSQIIRGRQWLGTYNASWLRIIGRLKPGENIARAQADLNVLFQQVLNGPAKSNIGFEGVEKLRKSHIEVVAGGGGFSDLRADFRDPLYLLMGIVGLVLLITCVNLANLQLARAIARKKEIAVRLSLGASRTRLLRQLLIESMFLVLLGGTCGLLIADWSTHGLLRLTLGAAGSDRVAVSFDGRVLVFTAAVSLCTGILFGLIPALRTWRFDVISTLKESSVAQQGTTTKASAWNWGEALVVSQVALSVLVLFTAGLLLRSLRKLENVDLGYHRDHLLLVGTDPLSAGYENSRLAQFYDEIVHRVSILPGVTGVTGSLNGLFSGSESNNKIKVEGYVPGRNEDLTVFMDAVGPHYFTVLGIPVILGRDIGPEDTQASQPVVLINEVMADFYFKNSNPIGRKIWIDNEEHRNSPPLTIVGVVHNAQDHDLRQAVRRRYYVSLAQLQRPASNINFEIRTRGNPRSLAETVRKQITNFDSAIPITRLRTLEDLINVSINNELLVAKLSSFFGLIALLLACMGLYGIMSYSVNRRTREIGVRMALGARRPDVLWLVMRTALKMILIGVMIGMPISLVAGRLIRSLLFQLKAFDPISMLGIIILLNAVAIMASLFPAQRATKVNPVIALKYE